MQDYKTKDSLKGEGCADDGLSFREGSGIGHKPPLFPSWTYWYVVVILFLIVLITLFYFFTKTFS